MKRTLMLVGIIMILCSTIFSQSNIPIIRATSDLAHIREGNNAKTTLWYISPDQRPDIYKTAAKRTRITIYTDIDSITFNIKKGKTYDFVILLNGKDSAFTRIMYESAKSSPGYLTILKKGRKYDFTDKQPILKFTYTSEQNPELVKMRRVFKLDSISGNGDELSKILNLLHWVHNSFVYDGTKELPEYVGTFDLMTKCIHGPNTLHCGAMAWVLNDCYLAMGIKSRHVVCLPKDSADFDCHSINTVYSKSLQKWLWIDPANNAYVMNENGEMLSIAEVRQRLIANKPLILNPDANLNRIYSVMKEYYLLSYMAKNLYAFQCYVDGGGESKSNVLLPEEYKGIIPRTKVNQPHCTYNPDVFWVKPE